MTFSSYHSSLSASINLCSLGAVFSPHLGSLKSFLLPGLCFSEALCLLATGAGGGFRLSEFSGLASGRRFRQEGVAMKKPRK